MAFDLDAYLGRIGYDGPRAPTLEVLEALHLAHPQAIAFENLDPLRGRPVALDDAALTAKLIHGRRGGYCFEHNRLLREALLTLGFELTGLAARVVWNQAPGTRTPRTHMLLRLDISGESWLADVGFGGMVLTSPLHLEPDRIQTTPHGDFRLLRHEHDWTVEARIGDRFTPLYHFDLAPCFDADYQMANWFTSTSPTSPFHHTLIAARIVSSGRATLNNGKFRLRGMDGRLEERKLGTTEAVIAQLEEVFGLAVPDDPALHRAIEKAVAAG
jgi:N-hydroxyarylamine O-acetyltransferase